VGTKPVYYVTQTPGTCPMQTWKLFLLLPVPCFINFTDEIKLMLALELRDSCCFASWQLAVLLLIEYPSRTDRYTP